MESLQKAVKLKSKLDALRPLSQEDESRIMQKFRLDWNYHSNRLEGNTLTYGETKALILFGITAQGKPLKDHFEMSGHNEAVNWIVGIVKEDRPITENFIRELHKLILKEPYEVDAITPDGKPTKRRIKIGQYKIVPNHVKTKTGEIFRFATPEETPSKMSDLIDWYRKETAESTANPILIASEFHYKFIRIHPFDDGNGRTARILMNFILLRNEYPPVVIKTEDKENYFNALRQADAGILEPFINYIGINLVHSLEIMLKGANGESIEEPDDVDKEISLLEQKLNSVSNRSIKVVKDAKSVLEVFDKSIVPLTHEFVEKMEKFGRLYLNNEFGIKLNNKMILFDKENGLESVRGYVKDDERNIDSIKLVFVFSTLNRAGFDDQSYQSFILFDFENTRYLVKGQNQVIVNKLYNEFLTNEEIANLVNTEVNHHKKVIELQIDNFKEE